MIVKQSSKYEIEVMIKDESGNLIKIVKKYYPIDSKQGQELIKKHSIIIDPEMEEF